MCEFAIIQNIRQEDNKLYFELSLLKNSSDSVQFEPDSIKVYINGKQTTYKADDVTNDGDWQIRTYKIDNVSAKDFVKIDVSFESKSTTIDQWLTSQQCTECYNSFLHLYGFWVGNIVQMKIDAINLLDTLNCCDCDIPKEFIDRILRITALEYAIEVGDASLAEKLCGVCNRLSSQDINVKNGGCGCGKK